MKDISIITCTYNPDDRIFKRLLDSISIQNLGHIQAEAIIADNNSNPSLESREYVQEFLMKCPWATIVVENKQGKTFAIQKAFENCHSPLIVNFDDDNEPDANYLTNAYQLFQKFQDVAIWGPGNIDVEFIDGAPEWVYKYTLGLFQQRSSKYEEYGCTLNPVPFLPFGTGLVCRTQIYEEYLKKFSEGVYSMTCRKGSSLSSCGDSQIVYTAVKNNQAFGVSPNLKIRHLIPGKRTTLSYVKRLLYGCYVDMHSALVEVFPDEIHHIQKPNNKQVAKAVIKKVLSLRIIKDRIQLQLDLSEYLGRTKSLYVVNNITLPLWLEKMIRILKLE